MTGRSIASTKTSPRGLGAWTPKPPTIIRSATTIKAAKKRRGRQRERQNSRRAAHGAAKEANITAPDVKNSLPVGRTSPDAPLQYESQNPSPRQDSLHDE